MRCAVCDAALPNNAVVVVVVVVAVSFMCSMCTYHSKVVYQSPNTAVSVRVPFSIRAKAANSDAVQATYA